MVADHKGLTRSRVTRQAAKTGYTGCGPVGACRARAMRRPCSTRKVHPLPGTDSILRSFGAAGGSRAAAGPERARKPRFSSFFAPFHALRRQRSPFSPQSVGGARPTDLISLPIPSQASRFAFVRRMGTPRQVVPPVDPVGPQSRSAGPQHTTEKRRRNAVPELKQAPNDPKTANII